MCLSHLGREIKQFDVPHENKHLIESVGGVLVNATIWCVEIHIRTLKFDVSEDMVSLSDQNFVFMSTTYLLN